MGRGVTRRNFMSSRGMRRRSGSYSFESMFVLFGGVSGATLWFVLRGSVGGRFLSAGFDGFVLRNHGYGGQAAVRGKLISNRGLGSW